MEKFADLAVWSDLIFYNFSFIIITLNDDVHNELCDITYVQFYLQKLEKIKNIFLYGYDRNDALNSMQLIWTFFLDIKTA